VNWQHFRAFLWLRWRLRFNQLRRAGTLNAVIMAILAAGGALLGLVMFVVFFLIGLYVLPEVSSSVILYVWDGLVVAFLFFWAVGLLAELQRYEVLSLDKFLHLPVSLSSAFLINYLSSLINFNFILFVPAMVGLFLGLSLGRGPALLMQFPLLAAFLLMITAVTYQFQGWLASLMVNQRRRRTVIVIVTMVFVLLCQIPNLVNWIQPWKGERQSELHDERIALDRAFRSGQITPAEYHQRLAENQAKLEKLSRKSLDEAEEIVKVVNLVFPPGWLPLGAMAVTEGNPFIAAPCFLGMALIGTASLWRSYRTTLRLYTGQFTSGQTQKAKVKPQAGGGKLPPNLLDKDLPWLPEQAAAIALGGFRSLTRAPEAKMMLLGPIIMVVIFGSMMWTRSGDMPDRLRPLLPTGAMAMVLLTMGQLIGNQFGFDRSGFRVFVLCPAQRRDVLLGKNLAVAPLALGLGMLMAIPIQALYPVRFEYVLSWLPLFISMYLLCCMAANCISIMAPVPIAAGSFRPSNPKGIPLLLHTAFVFLFPLTVAPALLPIGVGLALDQWETLPGAPICLVLSLLECATIAYLFRFVLTWQGRWLQVREQRILEIVTAKAE
jgi:hypothetical protein